jgi:hypothetical protein
MPRGKRQERHLRARLRQRRERYRLEPSVTAQQLVVHAIVTAILLAALVALATSLLTGPFLPRNSPDEGDVENPNFRQQNASLTTCAPQAPRSTPSTIWASWSSTEPMRGRRCGPGHELRSGLRWEFR